MKDAGVIEIAVIIGGLGSKKVRDYYEDGSKFGVRLTYIEQDEPKGIAHAINLARNFVKNENFLVFLGDNIIQKSIKEFAEDFEKSSNDATLLLCKVPNPSAFGIAEIKDEKIIKIVEKPKNPTSDLAVTGIYFLNSTIFDMIDNLKPSWRNELEITDALHMLLETDHNINYYMITNYWKDTGTPEDIIHANKEILENSTSSIEGQIATNVKKEGIIIIEKGAQIENDVKLVGPVLIGQNTVITEGATIGPNVTIGNDCLISKVKIKDSIIMNNCKISLETNLTNSIIASNSELGSKQESEDETFLLGEGTKIFL
jgi:glucose-1-phosphate thymidylyltransferase